MTTYRPLGLNVMVAISLLTMISGTGCSRHASPRGVGHTDGAGTRLGSGLVVPPGARPIGRVFPYDAQTGSYIAYKGLVGWVALLPIDRPGPSVFADLDAQI